MYASSVIPSGGSGQYFQRNTKTTEIGRADITTDVTVNPAPTGGGLPHPNFQPGYGCYYIIYIP